MPLVSIYTSISVGEPDKILSLVTKLAAAELGKPESIMMARLEAESDLSFGGTTDEPAALFEVEGIELSDEKAGPLTTKLCDFAEAELEVPKSRVFVKLTNVPRGMWGGNGKVY